MENAQQDAKPLPKGLTYTDRLQEQRDRIARELDALDQLLARLRRDDELVAALEILVRATGSLRL